MVIKIKIRVRVEHPGSYFPEFRNSFWVKILKFFDADAVRIRESFWPWIRDRKNSDPGSGINIPDPKHCS
jgi:hypothetical protein